MNSSNTWRMPAEWERQEAVILSWPHNTETWPFQLEGVRTAYVHFIREIADHQKVWLLVNDAAEEVAVQNFLTLHGVPRDALSFFLIPTHDAWVRDYGPIYVVGDKCRALTDWVFNGWGDKYGLSYRADSLVPEKIAEITGETHVKVDSVLEGGAIEVNGRGDLITTRNCLLNANRHSGRSQPEMEELLRCFLGVVNILWLKVDLAGDDTDGHIDNAVRFVGEDTVVCIDEKDTADANFHAIHEIQSALRQIGRITLVKIPMPQAVFFKNTRLPASYANFLITNEKILVPIFGGPNDETALSILQEVFPQRKVVGIQSVDLVYGLGSLHCLSQQVPARRG